MPVVPLTKSITGASGGITGAFGRMPGVSAMGGSAAGIAQQLLRRKSAATGGGGLPGGGTPGGLAPPATAPDRIGTAPPSGAGALDRGFNRSGGGGGPLGGLAGGLAGGTSVADLQSILGPDYQSKIQQLLPFLKEGLF